MSTNESLLFPNRTHGWRMGLDNMLAKEIGAWCRTRRWWVQGLIALLLLNGTMALNLKEGSFSKANAVYNAINTFTGIMALCVPFAAISLAQDSILGERHSGTAAWVLSKPLRRPAFILAKLIAHGLGVLVAWVVIPGTVAYIQLMAVDGVDLSMIGFAGAMALAYLNIFFYLTLALMLATLFNGRGPVLGISLVVLWSGPMQFIRQAMEKYTPWLDTILPWRLLMNVGSDAALAPYLAMGQPLPTVIPIIATVLWCVLFVTVAIWRFRREEF
jgi:ABC-type transport system involved in multi-copper enzyme maturation permease subunit